MKKFLPISLLFLFALCGSAQTPTTQGSTKVKGNLTVGVTNLTVFDDSGIHFPDGTTQSTAPPSTVVDATARSNAAAASAAAIIAQSTANAALPVAGGSYKVPVDIERNAAHWFDVRSRGAACNGGNDTSGMATALSSPSSSLIELPGGTCSITTNSPESPAPIVLPSTSQFFTIQGRGEQYQTTIQQANCPTTSSPIIQLGDDAAYGNSMNLRDFSVRSCGTGAGVSFPYGMIQYGSMNLAHMTSVSVKMPGTGLANSIGIMNVLGSANPLWAEMLFENVHVYASSASLNSNTTGVKLSSAGGNTEFYSSSIERFTTGMDFQGVGGTPVLTWIGGHFESISGDAFHIEEASLKAVGVHVTSGNIWLGNSVVGSNISIASPASTLGTTYIDNGIGNKFEGIGAGPIRAKSLTLNGDEWFRVPNNAVPDPVFAKSGLTGWTASAGSMKLATMKIPGAPYGQSIQFTPVSNGDYISQTFAVTPSTDYLFTAAFFFSYIARAAQVQVYDNTSTLVYDSGSFGGVNGSPAGSVDRGYFAYRVLRKWIPTGSATSFTIRLIAPSSTQPIYPLFIALHQSAMTMSAVTLTGTASCSGSGASYACTTIAENNGTTFDAVKWNITAPTYQSMSFVRFHASVTSGAILPVCIFNGTNVTVNTNAGWIGLVPGTDQDYVIPLNMVPSSIFCYDRNGPPSESMTISQVSVHPIYQQCVIPITTPLDGNVLYGVTPDCVQQRGPIPPSQPLFMNTTAYSLIGSGSASTIQTTGNIGPMGGGSGFEWQIAGIRTAGTGTQNYIVKVHGGANLLNATFTNSVTSGGFLFKGSLVNVPGSTTSQINTVESMTIGSGATTTTGSASSILNFANWTSPITLDFIWQAATASLTTPGTGCTTANGLATTTSGTGTGMTLNIVAASGVVSSVTIASLGSGYAVSDTVSPVQSGCTAVTTLTNADHVTVNKFAVYPK